VRVATGKGTEQIVTLPDVKGRAEMLYPEQFMKPTAPQRAQFVETSKGIMQVNPETGQLMPTGFQPYTKPERSEKPYGLSPVWESAIDKRIRQIGQMQKLTGEEQEQVLNRTTTLLDVLKSKGVNPEEAARNQARFDYLENLRQRGYTEYMDKGLNPMKLLGEKQPITEKPLVSHPLAGKPAGRYKVNGIEVKWNGKEEI